MPLFKVHATDDITCIQPHKPNVYTYENQTRDQQKIPMNFESTTQNTSDGQLAKKCRFCFQEEGRGKCEECLCHVRKKKERSYG